MSASIGNANRAARKARQAFHDVPGEQRGEQLRIVQRFEDREGSRAPLWSIAGGGGVASTAGGFPLILLPRLGRRGELLGGVTEAWRVRVRPLHAKVAQGTRKAVVPGQIGPGIVLRLLAGPARIYGPSPAPGASTAWPVQ